MRRIEMVEENMRYPTSQRITRIRMLLIQSFLNPIFVEIFAQRVSSNLKVEDRYSTDLPSEGGPITRSRQL
jgi:hypothetical protein